MRMKNNLINLPYYGGKAGAKAEWINSILPYKKNSIYVEPFAGMFSVLLNRPKSNVEIINDLNSRIVNYSRVVRDHGDEFADIVDKTLYSEDEFNWAKENLDNKDISNIKRALAFYIVVRHSMTKSDNSPQFSIVLTAGSKRPFHRDRQRIKSISKRIQRCIILNRPAEKILKRIKDKKDIIIYCDPPYTTANTTAYMIDQFNKDSIAELLKEQKGYVAISGYEDEWDCLDWRCIEKRFLSSIHYSKKGENVHRERIEKLWINFEGSNSLF